MLLQISCEQMIILLQKRRVWKRKRTGCLVFIGDGKRWQKRLYSMMWTVLYHLLRFCQKPLDGTSQCRDTMILTSKATQDLLRKSSGMFCNRKGQSPDPNPTERVFPLPKAKPQTQAGSEDSCSATCQKRCSSYTVHPVWMYTPLLQSWKHFSSCSLFHSDANILWETTKITMPFFF